MNRFKQLFASVRARVIAVTAAVALLIAGGAAAGFILTSHTVFAATNSVNSAASSSTAAKTPSKYCQTYLSTLEKDLNITQQQLQSANADALKTALQQAVTDGKMTQAQATAIENKIAASETNGAGFCRLGMFGGKHGMGMGMGFRSGHGQFATVISDIQNAVAQKLGISVATLHTDLQSGSSIVSIASQHGVSQTALNQAITAEAQSQLNTLVSSGVLTSSQETQFLTMLGNMLSAGHYSQIGL